MSRALFLGLDLSTQALKASLLDANLQGVDEAQVRFDTDLPEFHTQGGILPKGDKLLDTPDAAAAPVAMYVAALDKLMDRIVHERKWPIERIAAISSAGQQHASVYFTHDAAKRLAGVSPEQPLAPQLERGVFSRAIVPNWQDATTLEECDELMRVANAAFGEKHVPALCRVTGSIAHTRFTAAQILRWRKHATEQYANTAHITLVSNFLTSLLCAGSVVTKNGMAPLDKSDACGMNLWDMSAKPPRWSAPVLQYVSKETRLDNEGRIHSGTTACGGRATLERMLGPVLADPAEPVGHIGQWLKRRYGFAQDCLVCQATGDNPATLQCLTPRFGEAVLSLGTSDTILLPSNAYVPDAQYHTFAHPAARDGDRSANATAPYFLMFVYKNGSLAREWVRNTYCGKSWDAFDQAIETSAQHAPGSEGVGFYWLRPEILPWDARGTHRFQRKGREWEQVSEFTDPRSNAMAMVQSQFLDFRMRIAQVLAASNAAEQRLERVYVVGGAAENRTLCQLLANVLGCEIARPVVQGRSADSNEHVAYNFCSVGAAYRARWVWECAQSGTAPSFEDTVANARKNGGAGAAYEVIARPDADRARAYAEFSDAWKVLEEYAIRAGAKANK